MIIPIGTKSSLALKPKVTIGLIVINFIIAAIPLPLMLQAEKDFLKVQKQRYTRQIQLYLLEQPPGQYSNIFIASTIENTLRELEEAEDFTDFQIELYTALSMMDIDFEELERYGEELEERTTIHYMNSDEGSPAFEEWKRLRAKEESIINGNINFALGLVPSKMSRIHTFITYLFLHGGIWHLLGNMLFLWVVGCLLEDSWGRIPFLGFYLAGGAFAGLAHCLQDVSSTTPLIGASGAIAAAMGAFTIRHFWTKIKFFYFFIFFFRPFWGTFHLPAFVFLPFWFLEQVALKYISDSLGGSDVAYLAHIAGYAAGIVFALGVKYFGFEERYLAPRVQRKQVEAGVLKDPRFNEACELLDRGNVDRARAIFSQLVREHPDDLDTMQDISMMFKEKGLVADFGGVAGVTLKNLLLKSRFEDAAQLALEIVDSKDPIEVNPQPLMRVAKWFTENEQFGEAHDIYRLIIRNNRFPQVTAKASLALAKLLSDRMNNPREALEVIEDARNLPLDSSWIERISEMEAYVKSQHPEVSPIPEIHDIFSR